MRKETTEIPRVSIIVPIYNIQNFLLKCVQSLQSQTVDDIEIILVNDGSTDSSGNICDDLADQDPRVRVIHKPNGGLSDARNHGIAQAVAEFITCIDGDDYVSPNYLELLLEPFQKKGVDLSVVNFSRVAPGIDIPKNDSPLIEKDIIIISGEEAMRNLFLQTNITTSAWGKLYRRSAFEGIKYPLGEIHEDLPVTYRLFAKARHVSIVDRSAYFYVQHEASITSRADFNKRIVAITFAEDAVNFVTVNFPALCAPARVRTFMECVYLISQIPERELLKTLDPFVEESLRKNRRFALLTKGVPAQQRVTAFISYFGLPVLRKTLRAGVSVSSYLIKKRKS